MQNFITLPRTAKIILALLAALVLAEGLYIGFAASGRGSIGASGATTCQDVVGKWETENPEIAKAQDVFSGTPAAVDYSDKRFPKAKDYKTVIDAAVKDGVDFAGRYAIAQWGCGTQCQEQAIIDITTGKLIAMGLPSEAGVSTNEKYSVLITNPAENLPDAENLKLANFDTLTMLMNIPREYYVLAKEGESIYLKKLCTENPFVGFAI